MQAAFPETKGFSARNLWNMKKWYSFYTEDNTMKYVKEMELSFKTAENIRLQQIGADVQEIEVNEKLQQVVAEIHFPKFFGYMPWGHHVLPQSILIHIYKT